MQKETILNEKHKFPILTDEERRQVRTFSKFEDDTRKNETHIMMKIANSRWNKHEFDISALQKAPININGKGEKDKIHWEYSICSNFKYLPYPFSKTTLVTFVPKFKVYNRCKSAIFIYQNNCEDNLCLYPSEKNVFHWSDMNKKKEMRIRYDEYNISGKS